MKIKRLWTAIATAVFACMLFMPVQIARAEGNGSISGVVWNDNWDGIRSPGESMFAGVSVSLHNASDTTHSNPLQTVTTDANGAYSFTGLNSGTYLVYIPQFGNYDITMQNQGSNDAVDSDISQYSSDVLVSVGEDQAVTNVDAGYNIIFIPGYFFFIGGKIWNDADHDGIRDSGEAFIPNVAITVYNDENYTTEVVYSNSNGDWTSSMISTFNFSINYTVTIAVPSGYALSPMDAAADDFTDSDFDPATNQVVVSLYWSGDQTTDAGSSINLSRTPIIRP